jgi:hypothetical protein
MIKEGTRQIYPSNLYKNLYSYYREVEYTSFPISRRNSDKNSDPRRRPSGSTHYHILHTH